MTKVALSGASGGVGRILRPLLIEQGVQLRSAGWPDSPEPLVPDEDVAGAPPPPHLHVWVVEHPVKLTSVRRLVGLLREDAPTTAGPQLTDIEQLLADLRATHPHSVLEADIAIRTSWVPADLATTIHRLVQEATTNVRKHGDPDGRVTVILRRTTGSIEIAVNNRRLPGSSVGVGYGLVGMRERVEALGGTFAAGPVDEQTWIVQATLPLASVT